MRVLAPVMSDTSRIAAFLRPSRYVGPHEVAWAPLHRLRTNVRACTSICRSNPASYCPGHRRAQLTGCSNFSASFSASGGGVKTPAHAAGCGRNSPLWWTRTLPTCAWSSLSIGALLVSLLIMLKSKRPVKQVPGLPYLVHLREHMTSAGYLLTLAGPAVRLKNGSRAEN